MECKEEPGWLGLWYVPLVTSLLQQSNSLCLDFLRMILVRDSCSSLSVEESIVHPYQTTTSLHRSIRPP